MVAILWNLYGFYSASLFSGAGVETVQGLFLTSMAFVVWMCLGQVILPNLSKTGSTEADRYATANGVSESALEAALKSQMKWSRDGQIEMDRLEKLLSPSLPVNQRLEFLRTNLLGCQVLGIAPALPNFYPGAASVGSPELTTTFVVTHKTGCFSLAISTTIDVVI